MDEDLQLWFKSHLAKFDSFTSLVHIELVYSKAVC